MSREDRRRNASSLERLAILIERMDSLGADAEDAAARITKALGGSLTAASTGSQRELLTAIGDVIEIVTERSRLAHEAHRVISEMRAREQDEWYAGAEPMRPDGG